MPKRAMAERTQTANPSLSRPRLTRADKIAATRDKLFTAATEIVGAEGYGNASVAKITARARVAQGTFYNYFETQQDLFDQLLPELGQRMLRHIRARIADCRDGLKREEIGFRAFFEFLERTPEFYRILNEAETFSPKAFRDHMTNMIEGYRRALRRSQEQGGLKGYSPEEFDVIVCILLGARNYLAYRFMSGEDHVREAPDWLVRAYMKFVSGGLLYGGTEGPSSRAARGRAESPQAAPPASEEWRVLKEAEGALLLQFRALDRHREGGEVRSGVLLDLVHVAAERAARGETGASPGLVNLSVSAFGTTGEEVLYVVARVERRVRDIVHVGVTIREERHDGPVVMGAQATFSATPETGA